MNEQLERVIDQPDLGIDQIDPYGPRMPFPTSYVLTREQEDELVDHAMKRLEQLEDETGRKRTGKGDWWMMGDQGIESNDPLNTKRASRTFFGKRRLYDLVYDNDVDHRAVILGGIFADSNLVVPLARRIARQMTARATNYFFSTDPWFAVYPVGENDRVRADKAGRYTRWKMEQAHMKRALELGIERAFVVGESVIKTSWKSDQQVYVTRATVLVDAEGKDIIAADGDYILPTDLWIMPMVTDPVTGEPVQDQIAVLKRDGQTQQPAEMRWEPKLVTRRITHYNGPEAKVVHFLDFLCPLEAASIQEADCVCHLYDMPVMDLADQWKKQEEGMAAEEGMESTRKAINLIRELSNATGEPKNAQTAYDPSTTGADSRQDRTDPVVSIVEFHLRYDADGDGMLEDVMLVVDRNSRTPIFYDYEANVTPDGKRPFSVVRVNERPGRWYGIGALEMFETTQQIVDLTVNRWNFSQSRSSRVDFWSPHNTLEGRSNPHLTLNGGMTYTPLGNKKAADCLESVYLTNNKDVELKEMIDFFMQLAMNESGVMNANDTGAAGLDTAKLATGIRNIEKNGQEMFSLYLGHLEPGIANALQKMVMLLFANMDQMEVYRYFEEGEPGGEGAEGMQAIDPGEISDMEIDTQILLSRYRGEQVLEGSMRAAELVEKFYSLPYPVQMTTAQLYRDMLKALQVQNADKIIVPIDLGGMGGGPGQQPGALSAAVAPKPRQATPNL